MAFYGIEEYNGQELRRHNQVIDAVAEDLVLDRQIVEDCVERYFDFFVAQIANTGYFTIPNVLRVRPNWKSVFRIDGDRWSVPHVTPEFNRKVRALFNASFGRRFPEHLTVNEDNWRTAASVAELSTFKERTAQESGVWAKLD